MEYKYENGHIIPINNSISNKRLDRLEEVVKTLNPEGGVLTKEDIAEVAVKAEKALKTANVASNELSTFKTNVSNTYATKQSLSSYVKSSTLDNFATKESVQDISKLLNSKQEALTVEVLANGNIRIGNLEGGTKDFVSGEMLPYLATKEDVNELIDTINTQLSAI